MCGLVGILVDHDYHVHGSNQIVEMLDRLDHGIVGLLESLDHWFVGIARSLVHSNCLIIGKAKYLPCLH